MLIPDGPELIANFLESEQDASCKRNAFMMLIHADQDRALSYLSSCIDQVSWLPATNTIYRMLRKLLYFSTFQISSNTVCLLEKFRGIIDF